MNLLRSYFTLLVLLVLSLSAQAQSVNQNAVQYLEYKTGRSTPQHEQIVRAVYKHAKAKNLDPTLVLGLIEQESMFKPRVSSRAGAKGLMQVIPRYHKDKIRGRNIYDIDTNIDVGTSILREYMDNSSSMQAATRKYSGGASSYYRKIRSHQSDLKSYLSDGPKVVKVSSLQNQLDKFIIRALSKSKALTNL